MTPPPIEDLRALIAETVRDVVHELVADPARDAVPVSPRVAVVPSARSDGFAAQPLPSEPRLAATTSDRSPGRVETVRISTDADLRAFVRHLLTVFEDPRGRQELRAGRYRFVLATDVRSSSPGTAPVRYVEHGAVTERTVAAAAEAGERLVLGRRAVLTPLARDQARKLSVHVEKER